MPSIEPWTSSGRICPSSSSRAHHMEKMYGLLGCNTQASLLRMWAIIGTQNSAISIFVFQKPVHFTCYFFTTYSYIFLLCLQTFEKTYFCKNPISTKLHFFISFSHYLSIHLAQWLNGYPKYDFRVYGISQKYIEGFSSFFCKFFAIFYKVFLAHNITNIWQNGSKPCSTLLQPISTQYIEYPRFDSHTISIISHSSLPETDLYQKMTTKKFAVLSSSTIQCLVRYDLVGVCD